MHSTNTLCIILVILALIHSSTSRGDDPIEGEIGGLVSFEFHEQDGETLFDRMSGGVSIDALPVLDVSTASWLVGEGAGSWRYPLSWDATYNIVNGALWTKQVLDIYGDVETYDIRAFAEFEKLANLLYDSGPTERSVGHTFTIPLTGADDPLVDAIINLERLEVSATAGVAIRFHAIIASDTTISMDQSDVTLEELTLDTGAHLIGNPTMVIRTNVTNLGKFSDLAGSIEGGLENHAGLAESGGAYITGTLSVGGQLNNTGDIFVQSGSLNLASETSNAGRLMVMDGTLNYPGGLTNVGTGTILFEGGTLRGTGGLLNAGNFEWSGGTINGTVTNIGEAFSITGTGTITNGSVLSNSGLINHTPAGVLAMQRNATVDNLAGGTYDLQGDGWVVKPAGDSHYYGVANINNAGTFRKSAGDGEATIGSMPGYSGTVAFHNTGTVQVDSGTLTLNGAGSSTDGHYEFSNDAMVDVSSNAFIWGGINTASGEGVLRASGKVESGTTATFSGFTSGAMLEIAGAYGEYLYAEPDATLTLDLTGSSWAQLGGGALGLGSADNSGDIVNAGNFEWSGGTINGTATNIGDAFSITGTGTVTNGSVLSNSGLINHTPAGVLAMQRNATVDNLAGGTYDLQGDGWVVKPAGDSHYYGVANINNAGTFRKSAGDGEATIGSMPGYSGTVAFHNAGTVEVTSGTLTLNGAGSSTDGHYEFSNDAMVDVSSNAFIWGGINTASGEGVLRASGKVESGTTATFSGFTSGAMLEIAGAYGRTLAASPDATLTLDLTGSSWAKLGDGTLSGTASSPVVNRGNFEWSGGTISGAVKNVGNAFVISGDGGQRITNGSVLSNSGLISHDPGGVVGMQRNATMDNLPGGTYDLRGDGWVVKPVAENHYYGVANINNAGTFRKSAGDGEATIGSMPGYSGTVAFHNAGTVEVTSGTLTFSGGFTQTAGRISLNGANITSRTTLNILGGSVEGTGEIQADILNQAGLLSPGFSAGSLTVDGDYTQGPDASLLIEIAGWQPDQYDVVTVTGTAYLDGLLEVSVVDGFTPEVGDIFDIFNYGSYTGAFSSITGLDFGSGRYFELYYLSDRIRLETEVVPTPTASVLGSIGLSFSGWLLGRRRELRA